MDHARCERSARTDDDAACARFEPHDIERLARRNAQPLPLADGEMNDAVMMPEHRAAQIDDLTGRR